MPTTTPATVVASGPIVSSEGDNAQTPLVETRPHVVLRPTTPQHAAGIRMLPPVSEPYATSASSVATATAEPDDDPPGHRLGSTGFVGVP